DLTCTSIEVTCSSIEVTCNAIEVTCNAFEVTGISIEVTCNAIEVTCSSIEVTCNAFEVTRSAIEVTSSAIEATCNAIEVTCTSNEAKCISNEVLVASLGDRGSEIPPPPASDRRDVCRRCRTAGGEIALRVALAEENLAGAEGAEVRDRRELRPAALDEAEGKTMSRADDDHPLVRDDVLPVVAVPEQPAFAL